MPYKKNGENNDIVYISIYPLPPGLIMTTEKVTNHNNQCPPSLLGKMVTNSCLNEVAEISYLGESLLSYYVSEYIPTNPDHITAHDKVLAGSVFALLFSALKCLLMETPRCGCNRYRVLGNYKTLFMNSII